MKARYDIDVFIAPAVGPRSTAETKERGPHGEKYFRWPYLPGPGEGPHTRWSVSLEVQGKRTNGWFFTGSADARRSV